MNCKICGKELKPTNHNRKYCGSSKDINTCAGKVANLRTKLVSIRERCCNPNHQNYTRYSKYKIYKMWLEDSFSFVKWALTNGWQPHLQIDRRDNDKGYFPSNCRFVTRIENCRNKRKKVTDWVNKTRRCRVCRKIKPFDEFMISRKEIGGIAYECKLCRKEIDRVRWAKTRRNKDEQEEI